MYGHYIVYIVILLPSSIVTFLGGLFGVTINHMYSVKDMPLLFDCKFVLSNQFLVHRSSDGCIYVLEKHGAYALW